MEQGRQSTTLGGRLRAATGGYPIAPLVVLFALNLVDEFDRIAFGVLTPNIRDTFGLSDAAIVTIGAVAAVVALVGTLPIGYLADRSKRTSLVRWTGLLWGAMALLTGFAPVLAVLVVARIGAGVAHVAAEPLHASLLGDYYKPVNHPRVFAWHRLANPISGIAAVAIGGATVLWGWRPTFLILAIPTAILAVIAGRLPEPRRGETIDAELAALMVDDAPISFGDARRQLFAIPTLRRLWLASFFIGLAIVPIGQFLSLFFEEVYNFDAFERGVVSFLLGAASVIGLFVGERWATRAMADDRPSRLPVIVGASVATFGAGLFGMAVAPWVGLSMLLAGLGLVGLGGFQPAYYALIGLVAPPRLRAQAYSWALVMAGLGGLGSGIFADIGENSGYRTAIAMLAVLIVIFGWVQSTARHFTAADAKQAARAMATALEIRGAQDGDTLLACRGLEVAYDGVQVLFGVDLDVHEGEVVALLGTNGAGKSTVLNGIAGIVDPIGGTVLFDGVDITHSGPNAAAAAGIVVVPGGKAVFPTLTVREHLRAASWLFRNETERVDAAIAEVFELFPRLEERIDQPAGNLSGGEQQMLALSMAFIAEPRLLIIDELSLGLAPAIVEQLLVIVRKIQASGTAIVLVEQSINVALTVAERAYFLEKGEVRFEGLTTDLLERDDIVRSVFLTGSAESSTAMAPPPPTAAANGHHDSQDRTPAGPLLRVEGVTKRFGGITAVAGTDLEVAPGETVGLIGPNGAGKTTIFDLISGFLIPDEGTITFDGHDITEWSPDRRALSGLGRSFQDARLVPSLTVAENLALGLDRHLDLTDHLGSFFALPYIADQEEDIAWSVTDLVDLLNLGAFRDKFVRELSTGSRRIVDLAMCIAHQPRLLLLDEPSSGIAQRETEALAPLLRRIQAETGCALLVIEHDMPLISDISDRLIALETGRPIAEGTPEEVLSDPEVVASYLGGDMATINRSGGSNTSPSGGDDPPEEPPHRPPPGGAVRTSAAQDSVNGDRPSAENGARPRPARRRQPLVADRR